MNIELQIILGLNCNFQCSHCINYSGPQNENLKLSAYDISAIAKSINENHQISAVAFNGGEPLLFIKEMRDIQKKVTRKVKWSITTNGSMAKKNISILDELIVDHIVVSFDKEHEKFISRESVREVIERLKTKASVSLNIVVKDLDEAANYASYFKNDNLNINYTPVIRSGRAKKYTTEIRTTNSQCPNLTILNTKISYFSGKGFSICCGPLVFENSGQSDDYLYSKDIDLVLHSALASYHTSKAPNSKVLSNAANACEACYLSNQKISSLGTTLQALLGSSNDSMYFPIQKYLSWSEVDLLKEDFKVQYLYALFPKNFASSDNPLSYSNSIVLHNFRKPSNVEFKNFIEFVNDTYYKPFRRLCDPSDYSVFLGMAPGYFQLDTQTFVYTKSARTVGLISFLNYQHHPFLQTPAVHIGYWGYERNYLEKEEAQYIKNNWIKQIRDNFISKNIPAVALIDHFNKSSFSFAEKQGFQLVAVRLDKRED